MSNPITDERLAELIIDVDSEIIPDTGSEWTMLRARFKADHLLALRELVQARARGEFCDFIACEKQQP